VTLPQILFAAVVFLIGIPAATRNLTAAALVLAYFVVETLYRIGGRVLEPHELACIDLAVMALIYCKTDIPHRRCRDAAGRYRDSWGQLCAFWFERSAWDRAVLALFPVAWAFYAADPWTQWWGMYFVALAQILAAGAETFENMRAERAANALGRQAPDPPSSGVEFALSGGWVRDG